MNCNNWSISIWQLGCNIRHTFRWHLSEWTCSSNNGYYTNLISYTQNKCITRSCSCSCQWSAVKQHLIPQQLWSMAFLWTYNRYSALSVHASALDYVLYWHHYLAHKTVGETEVAECPGRHGSEKNTLAGSYYNCRCPEGLTWQLCLARTCLVPVTALGGDCLISNYQYWESYNLNVTAQQLRLEQPG